MVTAGPVPWPGGSTLLLLPKKITAWETVLIDDQCALDKGVKLPAFHFIYLYLTNKQNWFLQVLPQPLGFEGRVLLLQQPQQQ